MPPRGYRVVSLREPVYERLRRYAEERGFTSLSDAVQSLLDAAEASQALKALEERLSRIEALLSRNGGAEKPRVRWVRGLRSPERFFERVAEREGDEVIWADKGGGRYCYTLKGEALEAVERANAEGVKPEEAQGYLRELVECGLAYYDPRRGWRLVER